MIELFKKNKFEKEFIERVNDSQGIIHKVCGMYCDNKEHRKDLFQEILIELWKSYPSFRGESKFSTWMYRVGLNVAIQDFRKTKKKVDKFELLPDKVKYIANVEQDDVLDEEVKLLYKAIDELNKIEKAIIMLHLEDKKNEEIAEIVGITQNYVRVKMNRIKLKLKKILNQ